MNNNGDFSGDVREGHISDQGDVKYTVNEHVTDYPSFEELIARDLLKRIYGIDYTEAKEKLKQDALNDAHKRYNAKEEPSKENSGQDPIKIGVTTERLSDDEFIEYTKRRVADNKELDRFKAIKAKIRSTIEGRSYNEKAFNMFVKLHDIDKHGFFNRTKEDDALITEAIKLYGTV